MTRADWYATNYGGCWRTARKLHKCGGALCLNKIQPGEQYFDTMQYVEFPKTKKLCATCANEELKP